VGFRLVPDRSWGGSNSPRQLQVQLLVAAHPDQANIEHARVNYLHGCTGETQSPTPRKESRVNLSLSLSSAGFIGMGGYHLQVRLHLGARSTLGLRALRKCALTRLSQLVKNQSVTVLVQRTPPIFFEEGESKFRPQVNQCQNAHCVFSGNYRYATLDDWDPADTALSWQDDYLPVPTGWELAPNNAASRRVAAAYPWFAPSPPPPRPVHLHSPYAP